MAIKAVEQCKVHMLFIDQFSALSRTPKDLSDIFRWFVLADILQNSGGLLSIRNGLSKKRSTFGRTLARLGAKHPEP